MVSFNAPFITSQRTFSGTKCKKKFYTLISGLVHTGFLVLNGSFTTVFKKDFSQFKICHRRSPTFPRDPGHHEEVYGFFRKSPLRAKINKLCKRIDLDKIPKRHVICSQSSSKFSIFSGGDQLPKNRFIKPTLVCKRTEEISLKNQPLPQQL